MAADKKESDWDRYLKIARATAALQPIQQWQQQGNNGALLGNILGSLITKYFANREDELLTAPPQTQATTSAPNLFGDPGQLAQSAMGGYTPQRDYSFPSGTDMIKNAPLTWAQGGNSLKQALDKYRYPFTASGKLNNTIPKSVPQQIIPQSEMEEIDKRKRELLEADQFLQKMAGY